MPALALMPNALRTPPKGWRRSRAGQHRRDLPRCAASRRGAGGRARDRVGESTHGDRGLRGGASAVPAKWRWQGDRQRLFAPGPATGSRALPCRDRQGGHRGFPRAAAVDYGQHGILTNAVALGTITTTRSEQLVAAKPEVAEHLRRLHPLGRLGRPEEVAEVVAHLIASSTTRTAASAGSPPASPPTPPGARAR